MDNAKLEWMYKNSTENVDTEEYLLGRKIDRAFENKQIGGFNEVDKDILPTSIFANANSNIHVDVIRKLKEDPLEQIKQKEVEMRRQLLKNPVKLKKLQNLLKAKEEEIASKKEKKHKKKKKEDLDELLAQKYSKLMKRFGVKNLSELMNKVEDDDVDVTNKCKKKKKQETESETSDDKYAKTKTYKKKKVRKCSSSSSVLSSTNNSSDEDEKPKRKTVDQHTYSKEVNRHKKKSYSSSDESTKKSKTHSKRYDSHDRTSYRSKVHHSVSRDRRERHRSPNIECKKQKLYKVHDIDRNREWHNNRKKNKQRSRTPESNYHSRERHNRKSNKQRSRSPERNDHNREQQPSGNSSKQRSHTPEKQINKSKFNYSSEEEMEEKSYGLVMPGGKELPARKREIKPDNTLHKTVDSKSIRKQTNRPIKLSDKEKEKKLLEMMSNVKWRDSLREKNMEKYKEEENKEKKNSQHFDPGFLRKQLEMATSDSTVEQRIKANINNIQRSGSAMDKNFARR